MWKWSLFSPANNLHPSIKFTHELSNATISFLDTSSSLTEGEQSTYLYSKPTETNQYIVAQQLSSSSYDKEHTIVKLLESGEFAPPTNIWKKRLGQLKNRLEKRAYKQSIIKKSLSKAHNISRSSLLQYKEKQKCKRTPCVLTYHSCLRKSFNTIREHWTSVEKKSKQHKILHEPPIVTFKQPNSLRSMMVRVATSKPSTARVTHV